MLNRKLLTDAGLDKETVDIVMSLRNDIFEGYVPQKDVDTMVGDAEQRGKASVVPEPVNVLESDEYTALQDEYTKHKTGRDLVDEFGVKSKFADMVAAKIDPSRSIEDQIGDILSEFEEFFSAVQADEAKSQEPPKSVPTFGGKTEGSVPKGEDKPSFMDFWGFGPKK